LRLKISELVKRAQEERIILDFLSIPSTNYLDSYRYILNCRNELNSLRELYKDLEKRYAKFKKDKNVLDLNSFLNNVLTIKDYNVLIIRSQFEEVELVKDLVDRLADKLGPSLVFVANTIADKVIFICKSKISVLHAGNLVKLAALSTGGNGGGRNDFAQAGGRDLSKVDEALKTVKNEILGKL
jgi:alanyl-tRNA synthetase